MKTIAALLLAATFPTAALSYLQMEATCTDLQGYDGYYGGWPGGGRPHDLWITGICPTKAEWYDPEFHRQIIRIWDSENHPFSFVSFQTYDPGMVITSNRGGLLVTDYTQEPNIYNDPYWELQPWARQDPTYVLGELFQDVHWVHIDYGLYGPGDYEQFQFANFVFGPPNWCYWHPWLPSCTPTSVTEPGTALLVGGGLAFLALTRRRRRST